MVALAGCASHKAKAPSYDDVGLRPINADLVSWMRRLNVQPDGSVVAQADVHEKAPSAAAQPAIPTVSKAVGRAAENLSDKSAVAAGGTGGLAKPASKSLAGSPTQARPAIYIGVVNSETRGVLSTWASTAHWSVIWDAKGNGPKLLSSVGEADFVPALRALIKAGTAKNTPYPLQIKAYTQQRIVHVQDKE